MAFTIAGAAIDPHNGLNTDGLTCNAFNEETWFPSSSPVANTAEPGSPDATDTSGPTGNSGQTGHYLMTVPTSGSYWVATFNAFDPTVIAWVKVLSHPHTQLQGWTAAIDQTNSRSITLTTIAAGSNGLALPQTTINVASVTGFPTSGFLLIVVGSNVTTVQYTGVSGGNQFTGCTGGTGTLATGKRVTPLYKNGVYRRLVMLVLSCQVLTTGDQALGIIYSTVGGQLIPSAEPGVDAWASTVSADLQFPASIPVDPLGLYGCQPSVAGTGSVTIQRWLEVDF